MGKFKEGQRVRVAVATGLLDSSVVGLRGVIGRVNPGDIEVLIDGEARVRYFEPEALELETPGFTVGDWIEFDDVGNTRSRGPILEMGNGFASVGRWDVFSGKYIAHWQVYLAQQNVRKTSEPKEVSPVGMTKEQFRATAEKTISEMSDAALKACAEYLGAPPQAFSALPDTAPYGSIDRTLAERGARYGEFKDHALICQNIKAAFMVPAGWVKLAPDQKQALEVIADKIARMLNGDPDYLDNWHDIIGYAKLVENRLKQDQERALDTAIKNG